MHIKELRDCDLRNGDGIRVSIWFAGCEHRCPGCHNPETWEDEGESFDDYREKLCELVSRPEIQGITLTGGDPLFSKNRKEMRDFIISFKEQFRTKDIWCYTGYVFEKLLEDETAKELLPYIDVLIDGPYIENLRDVDLHWRGSSNQRVIDVKTSLDNGKTVLFCS